MTVTFPVRSTLAVFAIATAIPAQLTPARPLSIPSVTRLHTAPRGAAFKDYGVRAAGTSYWAQFGQRAFRFRAAGAADAKQPGTLGAWDWRTREVRYGEVSLLTAEPTQRFEGTWLEYRYPNLIERYDVLPRGVAQRFVIPKRPDAEHGDLVVIADVATELQANRTELGHAPIEFKDRLGRPRIRYGEAYAIDAEERRIELATRWTGYGIEIRVPAKFVANARFPLTIDPLTEPLPIPGSHDAPSGVFLVREPSSQLLLVVTRARNQTTDAWVFDAGFTNRRHILSVVGSLAGHPSRAGGNFWCVPLYAAGSNPVAYVQHVRSYGLNSGNSVTLPAGVTGNDYQFAAVAGSESRMSEVMLISGPAIRPRDVQTWFLDPGRMVLRTGPRFPSAAVSVPNVLAEYPIDGWVFTLSSFGGADLVRVWPDGRSRRSSIAATPAHVIAGRPDRMAALNGYAFAIDGEPHVTVPRVGDPVALPAEVQACAFDANTQWHWGALLSGGGFVRLGNDRCVVEHRPFLGTHGVPRVLPSGAIAFDHDHDRFVLVYETRGGVLWREAVHGDAANIRYGRSCPSVLSARTMPYSGHGHYELFCSGVAPRTQCVLTAGTRRDGRTVYRGSCMIQVAGSISPLLQRRMSSSSGWVQFPMKLPCDPVLTDVYFQVLELSGAASNGLHARIRP